MIQAQEQDATDIIHAALVKAQQSIDFVSKDAVNQHHRYAYASAEAIYAAARAALHSAGLAFSRSHTQVDMASTPPMLLSVYTLSHESGAHMRCQPSGQPWPIIEGNGRPLDKALAGALTTSMAYALRDLLLIPKEDEAEVDRRDDTAHRAGTLGVNGAVALRKRLAESGTTAQALREAMHERGITPHEDMAQWAVEMLPRIHAWCDGQKKKMEEEAFNEPPSGAGD